VEAAYSSRSVAAFSSTLCRYHVTSATTTTHHRHHHHHDDDDETTKTARTMHIRLLLPLVSAGLLAAQRVDADGDDEFAAAAGGRATVTVHAWPVSAATSTPFAEAVYGGGGRDATWQLLGDNNEEEEEEEEQERDGGGDELVRVGLAESDGVPWRGTVTTRRLLRDGAVVLRLEPAGASVWFVEVRPRSEVGAPDDDSRGDAMGAAVCGGLMAVL